MGRVAMHRAVVFLIQDPIVVIIAVAQIAHTVQIAVQGVVKHSGASVTHIASAIGIAIFLLWVSVLWTCVAWISDAIAIAIFLGLILDLNAVVDAVGNTVVVSVAFTKIANAIVVEIFLVGIRLQNKSAKQSLVMILFKR